MHEKASSILLPDLQTLSTLTYTKKFLEHNWNKRNQLNPKELKALNIQIYIYLCGHVESVLNSKISARLRAIKYLIKWDKLKEINFSNNGTVEKHHPQPVVQSLLSLISNQDKEASKAPFSKLTSIYNVLFAEKFKTLEGQEATQAIFGLRNIFAHGRPIYYEKEDSQLNSTLTLDHNPLQRPYKLLIEKQIISPAVQTQTSLSDIEEKILQEHSLKFFYEEIKKMDSELRTKCTFPPEAGHYTHVKLAQFDFSTADCSST